MAEVIRETPLPDGGWEVEFQFDREWVRRVNERLGVSRLGCALFSAILALPSLWFLPDARHGLPFDPWPVALLLVAVCLGLWVRSKASNVDCDAFKRQSPSGVVRFRIDDELLTIISDYGEMRYPIHSFQGVTVFPEVWVIWLATKANQLFPGEVSDEVRDFFVSQCERAGIDVKNVN